MTLQVEGLGLRRGRRWLLRDLSLRAPAGSITVVMGPNGAGKSSLLLALAGLLPFQDGAIHLAGRAIGDCSRRELAGRVAWQGDSPPSEFGLTVRDRLMLATHETPESWQLSGTVGEMELEHMLGASLSALSSGERQRVELVALMLRKAPVWLLDEPAAHLDLRHQATALAMLRREAGEGRTIVVVLHDIQQARAVADRVVLLDGAGYARCGVAAELLQPEVLAPLFGLSLMRAEGADGVEYMVPRYRE